MKQRKIIVIALFSSFLLLLLPINNVQALTGSFNLVTSKDNGDSYSGLCSNNQFIFVACGADGLRIYNKTSHNLLTTTYDAGYYNDVDVSDIWVFVSAGSAGLMSYRFVYNSDVDYSLTLNDTIYNASVDDYYTVFADSVSGNVFCGCGGDGVYAYSYDYDTGALTLAGNQLDDDGSAMYRGVTTDGSFIYTACGGDGLRAYIWDGSTFTLDDTIDDATDSYYDVIVAYDSNIYTAVGVNGTYVYSYAPGFNFVYNRTDSSGMSYTWIWLNDTVIYYSCQTEGLRAYLYYNTTSFQMDYLDVVHPVATTCIAVAGDEHYVYYSAYNAGLYTYTFNLSETTPITAPDIQTDPATGVSSISATLNGQIIDDGGENCTVRFEWGTTLAYGNVTSNQSKTTGQTFTATLSGVLLPSTTYHFRAVGNNTNTSDDGIDRFFTTSANTTIPNITTNIATTVLSTSATINGLVTDDGGETCYVWFQWGTTVGYGNTTIIQYKTTGQTFSITLSSLTANTTYHYRAFGNNSNTTSYGIDRTFKTLTLHVNVPWTSIFDDIGVMFTGGNHTLPNGTVIPVVGIFGGGLDTNSFLGIFIFLILFVLTALFGMGMLVGSVIFIPSVFAVIGYIPELNIIVAIIVGIIFGLGLNRLVRR